MHNFANDGDNYYTFVEPPLMTIAGVPVAVVLTLVAITIATIRASAVAASIQKI